MLSKCVNCEFYLSSNEKFCRSCGMSSPTEDFQYNSYQNERNLTIILTLVSAIVLGFVFVFLRNDGNFSSLSELPAAILFSLVPCFALSYIFVLFVLRRFSKKERRQRFAHQKAYPTLNEIQDTIMLRTYELNEKYREIEELLAQSDDVQNAEIDEKLEAAREFVASQIARYELHSLKIILVRLQNRLLPILYGKHAAENKDDFLDEVNDALLEIKNIHQSLTNDYAIEFPGDVLPEKEDFLEQLEEIKISCEKLRESLLSRQAARALHDISPGRDNLRLSSAPDLHHMLETFNVQTALTDFSHSFDALEHEYARLKIENEIEQKMSLYPE